MCYDSSLLSVSEGTFGAWLRMWCVRLLCDLTSWRRACIDSFVDHLFVLLIAWHKIVKPIFLFIHPVSILLNLLSSMCKQVIFFELENEKSISQIVGSDKWCDQNGDRVSKSNKSYYICMIRLKSILVKYERFGTLSIHIKYSKDWFEGEIFFLRFRNYLAYFLNSRKIIP